MYELLGYVAIFLGYFDKLRRYVPYFEVMLLNFEVITLILRLCCIFRLF